MDFNANTLCCASARGDVNLARQMLQSGIPVNAPNSHGRTPIQVMMMGSPQMAELLLDYGADPSVPDPSTGTCPTHDAAREGFLDTLLVLLRNGANLYEPRDNYGQRPIDLASPDLKAKLLLLGYR
ncbi:cyclin-dependent kinase inhibitor 2B L homeolog [Xenopus laevis]|uniref:Cyclin-dependent kinase inhibitor 2B L homeolog n=2 Tax=Xenopus laevis TaxID=8355 RepID=Q0IHF2_XENLA|nr:cyclin-dependent kinase inhibitor 2B L homeolog [Xenopus laevis]AAI23181.1 MGC154405 protein [Xenopus laevis]OCU00975.1 hypothetical protein XELAEV_18006754mg [Xenopus laevis]